LVVMFASSANLDGVVEMGAASKQDCISEFLMLHRPIVSGIKVMTVHKGGLLEHIF